MFTLKVVCKDQEMVDKALLRKDVGFIEIDSPNESIINISDPFLFNRKIEVRNRSVVRLLHGKLTAYNNSEVFAHGLSFVSCRDSVNAWLYDQSIGDLYNQSVASLFDRTSARFFDETVGWIHDHAKASSYNDAFTYAYDSSIVHNYGGVSSLFDKCSVFYHV